MAGEKRSVFSINILTFFPSQSRIMPYDVNLFPVMTMFNANNSDLKNIFDKCMKIIATYSKRKKNT